MSGAGGEGEGEAEKEHLVTKIRKVYSNKFDAVKQSLKQAKINRREKELLEEQTAAASSTSHEESTAVRKKQFDMQGFGAIIVISFFSTGFLFAMKKYIFKPGEFWKQGTNHTYRNRQQYRHRSYHNSYNNSQNFHADEDHMFKHYLTILELPTNTRPTINDVKQAYRKISLRTHPDIVRTNSDSGLKKQKYLEERFIMATKAHDELIQSLTVK